MDDSEDENQEMTICDFCAEEIPIDESYNHEGAVLCGDCYLGAVSGGETG